MTKLLSAALAAALATGTVFAAHAGEGEGVVADVDVTTRTVMLEDGTAWMAAKEIDLTQLAAGDMIHVTYEDGTTTLTSIEKVEM